PTEAARATGIVAVPYDDPPPDPTDDSGEALDYYSKFARWPSLGGRIVDSAGRALEDTPFDASIEYRDSSESTSTIRREGTTNSEGRFSVVLREPPASAEVAWV